MTDRRRRNLRARSTERGRVGWLALGFALLVGAWIMSTAPFAAPDEQSHYVRALGLSNGTVLGVKVRYPDPGLTPPQQAFINRNNRAVEVPAPMSPYDVTCVNGKPDLTKSCLESSPNGNFPPLGYVLPAVAISASHDATQALWLARLAAAVQSLAFLMLAVALLWDGTAWSLIGLLAATSPMVLFVSSVLNPSGIEIAASIAFAAAAIRIARAPAGVPRWVWVSFAVAGAVTILAGPIGLVFAVADLGLCAVLLGPRGLRELRRRSWGPLRVSALALAAAGAAALIYTRLAGFAGHFGISPIRQSLRLGLDQLYKVLQDAVGNFGAQTVPLPLAACSIWWLVVLVLLAIALWLGNLRDRLVLGVVSVLTLAFPVLFWAWVDRHTGFDLLGREVLPPLLLIPMTAGEVIYRHRGRLILSRTARLGLPLGIALTAAFQAYAWGFNAHVAPHDVSLQPNANWSPPLGWAPWIVVMGLGVLALLVFATSEALAGWRLAEPDLAPEPELSVGSSHRLV